MAGMGGEASSMAAPHGKWTVVVPLPHVFCLQAVAGLLFSRRRHLDDFAGSWSWQGQAFMFFGKTRMLLLPYIQMYIFFICVFCLVTFKYRLFYFILTAVVYLLSPSR